MICTKCGDWAMGDNWICKDCREAKEREQDNELNDYDESLDWPYPDLPEEYFE